MSNAHEVIEWARARSASFTVMALDGPLTDRLVELGGVITGAAPWSVQQALGLAAVAVPEIQGYRFRHVRRGDDGYPVPILVYRAIGFADRARTREIRFAQVLLQAGQRD